MSTRYDNSELGPKAKFKKLSSKMHLRHREKGPEGSEQNGSANGQLERGEIEEEEEEEEEKPSMSVYMCIGLLIVVTVVSAWVIY